MPPPRSRSLLVAAARMYYLDGLSQAQVARALNLSRPNVSRILAAAREQGVVEIRINESGPVSRREDLERALMGATGIRSAYVLTREAGQQPTDAVTDMAARLVEEQIFSLTSIGISWGRTVARFADKVVADPVHDRLDVYSLMGGLSTTGPGGNSSVDVLARKCGAVPHRFEAPAVVGARRTWEALHAETSIITTIEAAAGVQLAVVGIGSMGVHASPAVVNAMELSPAETEAFLRQNPVGDICGQFYDASGRILGPPSSERVIGIELNQLQSVPTVIGVAGGREKAPGTAGALRTGAVDTIVLDENLATETLNLLRTG